MLPLPHLICSFGGATLVFLLFVVPLQLADSFLLITEQKGSIDRTCSSFLFQSNNNHRHNQYWNIPSNGLSSRTFPKFGQNKCRCRNTLLALAGSTANTVTSTLTSTVTTTTTAYAANSIIDDGLSRGDARGAAIRLEGVSISRGNSQILKDIDWRIEPKAKWGLIGANGCGKSTLLKAIMEEISYDGKITVGTTQTVGYLQQTAVAGSTKSVFEEAASAMKGIQAARDELYLAEQAVASHDETDTTSSSSTFSSVSSNINNNNKKKNTLEQDLDRLDQAMRRYEQLGGYEQEKQVGEMLHGLGFTNLTQLCNELSGGWQMRVSFAKLLLSKPSLALLDEPSNHLDRSARSWLAQYLRQYTDGAMILVTHDKELLESCQHIAEITSAGTMQVYKNCTYSQYLALKEERAKQALSEYQKNAEKAAKLQTFVDKYGASATKASAAQSRVKQIDKMKKQTDYWMHLPMILWNNATNQG